MLGFCARHPTLKGGTPPPDNDYGKLTFTLVLFRSLAAATNRPMHVSGQPFARIQTGGLDSLKMFL